MLRTTLRRTLEPITFKSRVAFRKLNMLAFRSVVTLRVRGYSATRLHEGALCTQTAKDHQLTWNRRVRQRWLLLEPSSHKTQPVRTAIAELR